MHAIILASGGAGALEDIARPIAGAPLLVRQLEWLREMGVSCATVNRVARAPLPPSLLASALAATGVAVTWVPSLEPLAADDLACRAGFGDERVLVLAHARVGNARLEPAMAEEGMTRDIRTEADAQALTEAILEGRQAWFEVRGSQVAPGVWTARGARLDPGAVVRGPSYIGPGAWLARGAVVGPGAIVGANVVVERGARVVHARIEDGIVVGQGISIEHALVTHDRLTPHGGEAIPIDDELLLGRPRSRHLISRGAAAAAWATVAPIAVLLGGRAAAAMHTLAQVVAGSTDWIGVAAEDQPPVIDVESLLVPPECSEIERAAARTLYKAKKSLSLDARLLAALLLGAGVTR